MWVTGPECSTDSEVNQRLTVGRAADHFGSPWRTNSADHFGSPWQPGSAERRRGSEGSKSEKHESNSSREQAREGGKPTGQMKRGRTEKKEGNVKEESHDGVKHPRQG